MTMWCHLPTIFWLRGRLRNVVRAILGVAIITMLGFAYGPTAGASDHTLGFGGNLRAHDGQPVANGNYAIQFKIYQGGDGKHAGNPKGNLVWQETYPATSDKNAVIVTKGRFSVQLGSRNSLSDIDWSQGSLWLSMNVTKPAKNCRAFKDSACQGDGEMLPMTKVTASPFALDSAKLGGKTADQFVQLGGSKQTDSSSQASLFINKTGSGDFFRLQNGGVDALTLSQAGDIIFGTSSPKHTISVADSHDIAGGDLSITAGDGSSGGTLRLSGGKGSDGSHGVVVIDTPVYNTASQDANCLPNGQLAEQDCQFTATSLSSAAVLVAGFNQPDMTASLPDPAIKTAGRTIFISAHDESLPFEVEFNTERSARSINLTAGNSLSLLWNGQNWTLVSSGDKQADSKQPSSDSESTPVAPQRSGDPADISQADDISLAQVSVHDSKPLSEAPIGSIYYDASLGALRCYEESGWSDCSAAPDEFVSLSPSYANAVVRENGTGQLITDTCSADLNINDGTDQQEEICSTGETYNYYQWTSDEASQQTRSVFVTYKLPPSFKSFVEDSLALTARTAGDSSQVSLQAYRKDSKGALHACGEPQVLKGQINGSGWQPIQPETDSLADCEFEAGDSLVVQIDLTTSQGDSAFISDLDFMISR